MEYMSGISQFNFNPENTIQEFNRQLNLSKAFTMPKNTENDFDKIFEEKCKEDDNTMGGFMNRVGNTFLNGLNSVNDDALAAENAEQILASGGDISAHEVMIAAEKSNLSLQMAIQIRNKLLNAYTEINNMQI